MSKQELYNRLTCALTHDIHICDACRKCGKTGPECRMNLIRELAKAFKKQTPWQETANEHYAEEEE